MRKQLPKILITGGAGFIGSAFTRLAIRKGLRAIVVDKLTYAGDLQRLKEIKGSYKFYKADICDKGRITSIFKKEKPEIIVHFAAETHVDRSILDASSFVKTNFIGTQVLMDISRKSKIKKFIHISTDEVYGEIERGKFCEDSPLRPNSPYAASKAASDLLVRSYIRTYNFPAIIIRPCNNYGPWQHPEKLIPLAISKILRNKNVPVYGEGKNIREWLYVEDCAQGVLYVLKKGRVGEVYNLGSGQEKRNIDTVKIILRILKKEANMVKFVKDRLGHDLRYRLDSKKVFKECSWRPSLDFKKGLKVTLAWNVKHKSWLLGK